ncbi:hypothetical protein PUN28_001127 [Cardiocondyla obscurior]|uniref:Odorant receptor n=2 Tax=Cardiocondyla obscurior TaxID=286306 RepID=A0AAW2H3R8_9HYME
MRATSISTSVEIALRCVGIWPGLSYGTVSYFLYMISLVFALYFQYVYIFDHFDASNISNLIDALSITLAYSFGFFKLISLWSNRRLFHYIKISIEEDWNNVDDHDKSVSYVMVSNADLSRRCSNTLISIHAAATICYSVANLIQLEFKDNFNVSSRALPVKMEFPFEIDSSPLFEFLVVGQMFHMASIAVLVATIDCLVITLVLHVSGQIDILRQELLTLVTHSDKISQCDSIFASIRILINRHQRIILFSSSIEELYSDIALMQFMSNTIVICCIGFTIIDSLAKEGVTAMLKSAIFYVAVTLEAFIFCFSGEYLSAKSKSIGDAVYQTLWYNLTPAQCRILLFVILRSQKRLTITAGNIMDLSLVGFTSMMKASASYMSVLHAMY